MTRSTCPCHPHCTLHDPAYRAHVAKVRERRLAWTVRAIHMAPGILIGAPIGLYLASR